MLEKIFYLSGITCQLPVKKELKKKNDTASLRSGFDNGKPTSFFRVSKVLAACKGLSQI